MLFECKGTGQEPSLNAMHISTFVPQKEIPIEVQRQRLEASLQNVKDQLTMRGLPLPIVLSAFATGPIRAHYEQQSEEEQQRMETEVQTFFLSHSHLDVSIMPWNGKSFFMTQKEEAEMEKLAAESLYENLVAADLLDEDVVVFETWGTGRGSSQIGQCLQPIGMDKEIDLKTVVPAKYQEELQHGLAKNMFQHSRSFGFQNAKLVIALKSGFAMLLDDEKNDWVINEIRTTAIHQHIHSKENDEIDEGDEGDEEEEQQVQQTVRMVLHDEDASLFREVLTGLKKLQTSVDEIQDMLAQHRERLQAIEERLLNFQLR